MSINPSIPLHTASHSNSIFCFWLAAREMSHSLASLSLCVPVSSQKPTANSNLYFSRCPGATSIKAMAGNGRESLDHLRRQPTKNQPQQPVPHKNRPAQVAPIGLWDRFPTARTVQQMMETMERMMEDPFAYGGGWASPSPPTESGGYGRGRTPWEIKEGEGEYKMRFDMPGMTKEDVKVWVEEKMLVVKAEKLPRDKTTEHEAEWSAKSYGRYSSRIALPDNVQFEKIKAEVKDGVLYITIPKATTTSSILDINVE